jgi:hypothetical protein
MLEETERRGLVYWHQWAVCFAHGLQVRDAIDRPRHIREVSGLLAGLDAPRKEMLVTFCVDWVDDDLIARAERGEGQWSAAEVWRAVGWRHEQRGAFDEAEAFYLRALETARTQGAMAWELRAAIAVTELWCRSGKDERSAPLLENLLARCNADVAAKPAEQLLALRNRLSARIDHPLEKSTRAVGSKLHPHGHRLVEVAHAGEA